MNIDTRAAARAYERMVERAWENDRKRHDIPGQVERCLSQLTIISPDQAAELEAWVRL